MNALEEEVPLTGGGRTVVSRRGAVVFRAAGPWSGTVISLLRHLEGASFTGAPRVIGTGFDDQGRETLSFIEGDFVHPGPWVDDGVFKIGEMLRDLHEATASFELPSDAVWRPWFGRNLGGQRLVLGHCDTGPWNIVAQNGLPIAFIDWEEAGPVDRDFELAQACWLNAQLHDDDIAERVGLPPATARAKQMRYLLDGYGLSKSERVGFVDKMIAFAVHDAADQAIAHRVTPDSTDAEPLWMITWRVRSANWMLYNRSTLELALG